MVLDNINVKNFRNYDSLELKFSPGINIIYGDNAQGKTNLLESIYVLALTKSHRSFIDQKLIQSGKTFSKIKGKIIDHGLPVQLEISLQNKSKKIKIDKKEIRRISEYISKMNIIIFYPEDLELVKGSPGLRRRYLNAEISQLDSRYLNINMEYQKILKMRNEYLKKMNQNISVDESYFNILNHYFVERAVQIYEVRKKFIDDLNEKSKHIFFNLSNIEGFVLKYKASIELNSNNLEIWEQLLTEKMEQMLPTEIKLGSTVLGPHRDDFEFYVNDKNLKYYGSQGQQRMAILSLKLAEIDIFLNEKESCPILLLDDVFSELDDHKKNNLLGYIKDDIQTIITTTDLKNIDEDILKKAKLIKISGGKIETIQEEEL